MHPGKGDDHRLPGSNWNSITTGHFGLCPRVHWRILHKGGGDLL